MKAKTERLLREPHLIHQGCTDDEMPNAPIAVCVDAGGMVCLSQEARDIVVDPSTIDELCKALKAASIIGAVPN